MRVLIVASFNREHFAPFILEQTEALKERGNVIEYFGLQGKGWRGYLGKVPQLKRKIKAFRPDIIHAHYGLSGLFANLQRQIPVVTTYHGSDINDKRALPFSQMAIRLSTWNVFVSKRTLEIANPKKRFSLIPCGIDLSDLQLTEKNEARNRMRLRTNKKYILFGGAFDNIVKNAPLAQEAIALLGDNDVELLELKGYTRDEVTLLMCSADALLMTSYTEGSPQVIKEALACGCPIVSVDVGDVKERIEGVEGCFVAPNPDSQTLAELLRKAIVLVGKNNGREKIIADHLENKQVADKLMHVYKNCYENH